MLSPTTLAQKAVIAALKADAAVIALVPAARIYPPKTPSGPTKPFIRYGSAGAEPERLSGIRGGVVAGAVHVFVGVTDDILDPGQFAGDAADAIAEAIDAVDNAFVERTQVMPDAAEPDVVHGIVWFRFTAAEFT
jgi:hypothetical protein